MQAISIEGGVTAAQGFLASGMYCGIRKNKSKPDLALIYSKVPCAAAAVYTQNLVCLLYTSPSPRDMRRSRMPSSA